MQKIGHVQTSEHATQAVCTKCGARIRYQLPMHLDTWAEILKAFIRKHKDCDE